MAATLLQIRLSCQQKALSSIMAVLHQLDVRHILLVCVRSTRVTFGHGM